MPDKRDGDTSKAPEKSRLQKLKDNFGDDYQPEMPPLMCGEHVLEYLWQIGPVMVGSMGEGPLTHAELRHYQDNSGVELSSWEALTLAQLSKDYFAESHRATKRDCPAPWKSAEQEAAIRIAVARDLEAEMLNIMDM